MPVISVRIPQLGEGLQEALLVEFLKQPGDVVKRDEPIYVMETDKATTDVESPYDGKLVEWTVETGTVLQIGAEIDFDVVVPEFLSVNGCAVKVPPVEGGGLINVVGPPDQVVDRNAAH